MLKLRQHTHSGEIDYLNIISFISVGLINLINQIIENKNLIERSYLTMAFFILALLIYIFPFKNYLKALIYLVLAIFTHRDMIDPSGFGSASLFLLSYDEIKKKPYGIILCFISGALIAYKTSISGDTTPQAITSIVLYTYLYMNFYIRFFKSKPLPKIKIKNLNKKEKQIISLMASGCSQKVAGYEMGLDVSQANELVKKIRKDTGIDSIYELMFKAGKVLL